MSPPTEPEIREALRVVGEAARRLGVERSPDVHRLWKEHERPFSLAHFAKPEIDPWIILLSDAEALGWTALAAWIEGGQPPIVPLGSTGKPRGWTVQLADRHSTVLAWSREDSAAIATLARALLVLRRWSHRVEPWGLRDAVAEALDRVAREASVMAEGGPKPWTPITDPIPAWYLAAFGTADE